MASNRLTNVLRNAFIRAVMDDVPKIDYEERVEKLLRRFAYVDLPETVKAVYDNQDTREFLETRWYYGINKSHVLVMRKNWKPNDHQQKELDDLTRLNDVQNDRLRGLRSKLRGAIYSVTTINAAKALLHEFEKYLPADEPAAIKTLPAIANLVADFTQAGWPKEQVATA